MINNINLLIKFSIDRECIGKFGDTLGKEVWDAINSVFDVLPLAAIIDDKVCISLIEIYFNQYLLNRFFVYMVVSQVLHHVQVILFQQLMI